ncbi:MAG: hypothetical protein ACRDLY_10275 [Thermoleophilaceae bacterium]
MSGLQRPQLEALEVGRDYAAWHAIRNHRDRRASMPLREVPEHEIERVHVVEHDPKRERQFKHRSYSVHRIAPNGTIDESQYWMGALHTVCSWEEREAELRRREQAAREMQARREAAEAAERRALDVVRELLPDRDPRSVVQKPPFMDEPLVILGPEAFLDLVEAARRGPVLKP